MSVKAAPTTSTAPAKPPATLGQFERKDFSDVRMRQEVYKAIGFSVAKTTSGSAQFASCCGSRVSDAGKFHYPIQTEPGTGRSVPLTHDGTAADVERVYREYYSQEFKEAWLQHKEYYHPTDVRMHMAQGLTRQEAEQYVQKYFDRMWKSQVIENEVRLIFAWDFTSEEAIKRWYTHPDLAKKAKGLDFDDPHDGKACLIWIEEEPLK